MSKIKIMDELLANKIAAGEVVEKIVSVVKELVENSVDAKSTEIKIELVESGLREIKVTDNGIGMDKEDALLAFQRHATSKIYNDDDLFNIRFLGFRGEALPSIAAVSDLVLRTCTEDNDVGTFIHIKGGKIIETDLSYSKIGTSFTITNLFYNTPARFKHLASSYSELANVIDYINKMALSYTNIKFTLINDNRVLLNTDGSGNLLKVIKNIYGIDVAKRMIEISASNDDYKITGYTSLPEVSRASKNHMTTIVNGRVVKNTDLYKIINESYSNYKEDSKYPICVLLIDTDPRLLDVNIHPSKLDIKFSNFEELKKLISTGIINSINNKLLIPNIEIKEEKKAIKYVEQTLDIDRNNMVHEETNLYNLVNMNNSDEESDLDIIDDDNINNDIENEELEYLDSDLVSERKQKLPELYPTALLLGTYIVCENEKGIYLIDQHAAKERINYEKIRYELSHPNNNTVTPLVPILIELPKDEFIIIKNNLEIFNSLNIVIEEFGNNSFRVITHPAWFYHGKEVEITKQIFELILSKEKDFSLLKFRDNLAKSISCKMSIKGNTYIDKPSMESLINDLRKCDNPYNCPHGRPTIIHFTIYELEKMFKRSI